MVALVADVAGGSWWNNRWQYRRRVTVEQDEPTGLPGDDVVAVTMPTGGPILPEGQDIRVVTTEGDLVPHRVLMVGPGDQVRLAFAYQPGQQDYDVYFGNPNAPANDLPLTIRRGVLQETWIAPEGRIDSFEQVQDVFGRADALVGRGFRGRIFQGYSPFGAQARIASVFTGYVVAPRDGDYTFCTSSQDASFLVVDDELVVSNGGPHAPQGDVSQQGQLRLTEGLHRLAFYHVNTHGDPVVVVAWQAPGGRRIWPMEPGDFAPVFIGQAGPLTQRNQTSTLDFRAVHAGEAFLAGRYLERFEFEATASGRTPSRTEWKWDFGDGTTAEGQRVEHVYLAPGEYTVTLTADIPSGRRQRAMTVAVWRPWEFVTQDNLEGIRDYAEIVSAYELAGLETESLGVATVLFDRMGQPEGVLAAGSVFVARETASGEIVREATEAYAEALLEAGRAEDATAALIAGHEMTEAVWAKTILLARAGHVMLAEFEDVHRAEELFAGALALSRAVNSEGVRLAQIGMGDVWRVRGDAERAAGAYAAARPPERPRPGQGAFEAGDFARHVEYYLRSNELWAAQEYLDRWSLEHPGDKLVGTWSLLTAQTLMRQSKFAAAAREAEVLVGVSPDSPQGPVLLMLAANCYHQLDLPEDVVRTFRAIIATYPESPYAEEAAQKLEGQ